MQLHIIYTFPFTFPLFPRGRVLLSRIQKGANDNLGLVVDHRSNYEAEPQYCSFLSIDMKTIDIVQSSMFLPYRGFLTHLHVYYSQYYSAWYVALDAAVYNQSADVYMVPQNMHDPWIKVFTARMPESDYNNTLVGFWQREECSHLLFSYVGSSGMYDRPTYWTHWANSQIDQPSLQYLNSNYRSEFYVCDAGCLLFTLQCVYDEVHSSRIYSKIGSGQWRFHIAAYTHTGAVLHQKIIPSISLSVRDM